MKACEIGFGRDGHRGGGEILHLLQAEVQFLGDGCEFGHVGLVAAGVGRNEVGNELLPQVVFHVHPVKQRLETLEQFKRGLAHEHQHIVAGVLGSDFEPS